jgi:ABC-type sugar transport system ATPase subunit
MVFQNYSLYPHMNVRQNLGFPLKVAGVNKNEIKKRVIQTAETLDLSDRLDYRPSQLSGGQRQRVALGRAIIREPDLFLLDEPLSNLDTDLRVRMRREIVRIQKSLGVTTVYVTHDQEEALTMADQIALLNESKIEQVASPKELYENPATLYAARFVGSPRINILDARIERHLLLPLGLSLLNNQLPRDCDRVTVGLRPEQISIRSDGEYRGKIEAVEFLGDQYVVDLRFQQTLLKVSGVPSELKVGQEISFGIDSKSLLFFDSSSGKRIGSS